MDKGDRRGQQERLAAQTLHEYPGYPPALDFSAADEQAREYVARRINQVRRQLELLRIHYTESGIPLYLDDLTKLNAQLDAVQGRLLHGEYVTAAADTPERRARLTAADQLLLGLVTELAELVAAVERSPTPVQDFDAAQALAARLLTATEQRFAADAADA